MACMEHECLFCWHIWFDNWPGGACPKCGNTDVAVYMDEPPDYDYEPEEEEEEED